MNYDQTQADKEEGTPKVKPHKIDMVHVFVMCPYCGEEHVHGTAEGHYEGSRESHCHKGGQYYIERVVSFENVIDLGMNNRVWLEGDTQ